MGIRIAGREIGPDHPPYVIAELSANHNGSLQRALDTIDAAVECGADAIKIQTYTPDTMTIDCGLPDFQVRGGLWDGYKLYDLYKWAHTPFEWHDALFARARERGITIFSTPFDETAVDFLSNLRVPAWKVASFELPDLPLIRRVAATGLPMIMSTGMASLPEIADAVTAARQAGCHDIVLLHCISSYPAPVNQANVRAIPRLAEHFGVAIGLSDHTLGTTVSVAAVAIGACVIEKHFTLSRADKGPDCDFSLEPDEFTRLCREVRDAWEALGDGGFARQAAEDSSRVFRRSIYFVRDLPAEHIVEAADIRRIRPGFGLPPKFYDQLIGKTLRVPVTRGTPASWSLFKQE